MSESSCEGLRTLLIAVRVVDESEFEKFKAEVAKADSVILNRD